MPQIARVKMRWSGFNGAPGYSVFHLRDFVSSDGTPPDHNAAATKIDDFALGVSSYLPNGVSVQVMSDIEVIDEATGNLIDVKTITAKAVRNGTATAGTTYAAAVGGVITWRTGLVVRNRRVRGRTFLVPFASTAFESNGTLSTATVNGLTTLGNAMINQTGAADLGIWSRPTVAGASDGVWAAVTSFSVPDMSAVLRSRRD